jgi:hypothetical protein
MCYTITPLVERLFSDLPGLMAAGDLGGKFARQNEVTPAHPAPRVGEQLLLQARHDVRATGWALAIERVLADSLLSLRGPEQSAISPPPSSKPGHRGPLSPAGLSLPNGRIPHDFLRTVAPGERVEVERFQSIRPDVSICARARPELFVELDDRLPRGLGAAKLERYDHFLAGWSVGFARYARTSAELPVVAFVCRDGARARECARCADGVLGASRAYAGEYPSDWEYPGRERVVFVAERDAHQGLLHAWGVPPLPPSVRVAVADGDPRARDPRIEQRALYPGE